MPDSWKRAIGSPRNPHVALEEPIAHFLPADDGRAVGHRLLEFSGLDRQRSENGISTESAPWAGHFYFRIAQVMATKEPHKQAMPGKGTRPLAQPNRKSMPRSE